MARALVWDGATALEVRDVPDPVARPGWVLVDVEYAGVCGTDLHVMHGEHPRAVGGIVLGHELVGTVAGDDASLPRGTTVFVNPLIHCGVCAPCRRGRGVNCEALTSLGLDHPGAMCVQVAVPAGALVALPADIDRPSAAMIEPLSICVRAVRRSGLQVGDRAHVIGAGPIGCLLALVARAAGATVTVSEPSADRRQRVEALGFVTVAAPDGDPVDVVFDATGHDAVPPTLDAWVTAGGTIVIVGAYATHPQSVHVAQFMYRELTMLGSKTYEPTDIQAAIALITSGAIDLSVLISGIYSLDQSVAAIDDLSRGRGMKVLVQPGG